MALVLNGSGITSANLVNGTIVDEDVADVAASKLTGALPAISGASLTGLTSAQMPAGSVVQVVSTNSNASMVSTSLATMQSTGITVSLTPKFATSKMVIFVRVGMSLTTTANKGLITDIFRGGSSITGNAYPSFYYTSGGNMYNGYSIQSVDTPSTTSAITYEIYFKVDSAGSTVYASHSGALINWTVMEIAQ